MPASRMCWARVTNSRPSVLRTVGLLSVRRRTRSTVRGSGVIWRACLKAASNPLYIEVRPFTEMAFTAAAISRELPTRDMGSWTVTVTENETIEIWSVGRSCLSRPSAAALAWSIFSPSMDPLESMAREMLRFLPAMAAADGVRSTATYTDVPEFGFRCARLTVHSIANGDRFVGRFWVSRAGFIFPPESRAMAARLSYLLRRRSHGLILTPGGLRAEGNPSRLRVPSRPRIEIVCDTRLRVWSSCCRPVMCSAWSNLTNLDLPPRWRDRCGRRVELPSAGNLESRVESRLLRYSGADRPREPCGTDRLQPEHGESAPSPRMCRIMRASLAERNRSMGPRRIPREPTWPRIGPQASGRHEQDGDAREEDYSLVVCPTSA